MLGNVNAWHHNMSIDWKCQIVPEDSNLHIQKRCGFTKCCFTVDVQELLTCACRQFKEVEVDGL